MWWWWTERTGWTEGSGWSRWSGWSGRSGWNSKVAVSQWPRLVIELPGLLEIITSHLSYLCSENHASAQIFWLLGWVQKNFIQTVWTWLSTEWNNHNLLPHLLHQAKIFKTYGIGFSAERKMITSHRLLLGRVKMITSHRLYDCGQTGVRPALTRPAPLTLCAPAVHISVIIALLFVIMIAIIVLIIPVILGWLILCQCPWGFASILAIEISNLGSKLSSNLIFHFVYGRQKISQNKTACESEPANQCNLWLKGMNCLWKLSRCFSLLVCLAQLASDMKDLHET